MKKIEPKQLAYINKNTSKLKKYLEDLGYDSLLSAFSKDYLRTGKYPISIMKNGSVKHTYYFQECGEETVKLLDSRWINCTDNEDLFKEIVSDGIV